MVLPQCSLSLNPFSSQLQTCFFVECGSQQEISSSSLNWEHNKTFMFGEDGAISYSGTSVNDPGLFSATRLCKHSPHAANTALACVESVTLQFSQATAVVLLLHKCLLLHVWFAFQLQWERGRQRWPAACAAKMLRVLLSLSRLHI